ncbi:MAG: hypothetical protein IPP47_33040 [Bryobacterales bacterium]|nr:hypothetical protein [Bryobacterales bacterium]
MAQRTRPVSRRVERAGWVSGERFVCGAPDWEVLGASSSKVYLGRDLQVPMTVLAASEAGMDGMVLVRSSDPSRLLVSARGDLPGSGQILLEDVDRIGPYWTGSSFVLQALADSGEVELVVEGRATASPQAAYPRQRIRVILAPTALFLSSPKVVSVPVKGILDVVFAQAPLLADGTSGPARDLPRRSDVHTRAGHLRLPGLQVLRNSSGGGGSTGNYRIQALALRDGAYTLTPTSSSSRPVLGRSLRLRWIVHRLRSDSSRTEPTSWQEITSRRFQSAVLPEISCFSPQRTQAAWCLAATVTPPPVP